MSPAAARTTANVLLAGVAGLAVYAVLKAPALRQTLWRAVHTAVTVTIPGYLIHELKEAWVESARSPLATAPARRP